MVFSLTKVIMLINVSSTPREPSPAVTFMTPDPKSCTIQKQNADMINTPETEVVPMKKLRFTEEQIVFALKHAGLTRQQAVWRNCGSIATKGPYGPLLQEV